MPVETLLSTVPDITQLPANDRDDFTDTALSVRYLDSASNPAKDNVYKLCVYAKDGISVYYSVGLAWARGVME